MIAQILFNTQPSIYNTTIEILTREQSTGTAVPTLLQIKNEFCQVYSKFILSNGKKTHETALTAQTSHNNYNSNKHNSGNSGRKLTINSKEIVNNVETKVANQVTVGKKMQTKTSVPTIGNQLQEQMKQLMCFKKK
jgi:hypothetical protein